MLRLENITKTFHKGTPNEKHALHDMNFQADDGDFITVIGTNGAGKSTLLNIISGVFMPDAGAVILDGEDITKRKEHQRARHIGRLFQDPMKGTAPNMTIEENLGLAYARGTRRSLSPGIRKKDRVLFRETLAALDLGLEDRMQTKVKLLSGGQRQALTLMMATIKTPKLLLLDEHTAALDPVTAEKVMRITDERIREHKITTLMITHDVRQALQYGNKTVMLSKGRIVFTLGGEQRKNMGPDELVRYYTETAESISDTMLFSVKG
ncbi:MAG: ATP-binding cassette domain-containing protein [Eubacteriales bacterium]|nr:ATP-binding cassette domain-containing protein [Eubacteriales bacterium]